MEQIKNKTIEDITEALQLMEQVKGLYALLIMSGKDSCRIPTVTQKQSRVYNIDRGSRLAGILQMWAEQHKNVD
jgi:hypothetical protein